MIVSLIVTTYNAKKVLELVLQSALNQSCAPFEIIVADDGSSDGTRQMIAAMAKEASTPIVHSLQEDKGFRAAMSRNKAMALAKGDYIILIDGDMVLEHHFIEDHMTAAEPGIVVQGGRVILSPEKSKNMLHNQQTVISLFDSGLENRKNRLRSPLLSLLFSKKSTSLSGIKTCNMGFWKKDAMAINGFNENFVGWGREDSEFVCRLYNNGVRRKNLRFMAVAYHLYHPICSRERLVANDDLLEAAITRKKKWCTNGIDNHLQPG